MSDAQGAVVQAGHRVIIDLDAWLAEHELPAGTEHPIWLPSGIGRGTKVRSAEHLTVLISNLSRQRSGFASIELRQPFPHPWAQTAPAAGGLIVELNDGFLLAAGHNPCTRRAFRGQPGSYPLPDEGDPRYQTSAMPMEPTEVFTPLEGADLIWMWTHAHVLPAGISVTMRHFGARDRRAFGCGDL